jgi:MoxR-like ATPase
MSQTVQEITAEVGRHHATLMTLTEEVGKVMVGQRDLIEKLLIGLLADGHILVEGVPGLAKTTAIKTLAQAISGQFARIQFTPDLLPADVIGTQIYSPKDGNFSVKHGPINANLLLADEINRAPAKVQSALLEAMQERQVTIGEETFRLPDPFLVMATQNPVEQEGTYPLPEAQVDRFMLKVVVTYPTLQEEISIMHRMGRRTPVQVKPVVTLGEIAAAREIVDKIFVDDKLFEYVANLVAATRNPELFGLKEHRRMIEYGASPRASIYLIQASKAYAFLQGRGYVTPQDIKTIGMDVMRHRVMVSYEGEARDLKSENILMDIFDKVDVP